MAPDGVRWQVGRRWLTRRPKLGRPDRGEVAGQSLNIFEAGWPELGNVDLGEGLLAVAAVVAVLLILVPMLFFGVELIILGALLAAGVVGHTLLGQPWVIEARSIDPLTSGRQLEWRVRGWRKSGRLIAQIATDLSAGREPDQQGLTH